MRKVTGRRSNDLKRRESAIFQTLKTRDFRYMSFSIYGTCNICVFVNRCNIYVFVNKCDICVFHVLPVTGSLRLALPDGSAQVFTPSPT